MEIDLSSIDETDRETWDAVAGGYARGVFHIESPNMYSLLLMTDCRDIECLTAIESVIRPGADSSASTSSARPQSRSTETTPASGTAGSPTTTSTTGGGSTPASCDHTQSPSRPERTASR